MTQKVKGIIETGKDLPKEQQYAVMKAERECARERKREGKIIRQSYTGKYGFTYRGVG